MMRRMLANRKMRPWLFLVLILMIAIPAIATRFGLDGRLALLGAVILGWITLAIVTARFPDANFEHLAHGGPAPSGGRAPRLRIGHAILVGEAVVNVPCLLLMLMTIWWFGSWISEQTGFGAGRHSRSFAERAEEFGLLLLLITVAAGVAWLWWAIALPRWRLWALRRVGDPIALKQAAIGASLMWPEQGWGSLSCAHRDQDGEPGARGGGDLA